jgi:hypothetical protein
MYSVDPAGLAALEAYFERFWTNALAAFKDAAEHQTQEQR